MPRTAKHLPRDFAGETRKLALAAKLKELRAKRRALDTQLRHLEKLWANKRPWHQCKRCGHEWRGIHFNVKPTHCARCHSAGWNRDAKHADRARKPTDSPHPGWETRNTKPKKPRAKAVLETSALPSVPIGSPMVHVATVEEGELYIAPDDLMDKLRARLVLPAGLPPPPSYVPSDLDHVRLRPGLELPLPPPPSLTVPEPQLYRPRVAEEPQPESITPPMPLAPPSPPEPEEPEPDWEAILPKISLEFDEDAVRGEEAWLDGRREA